MFRIIALSIRTNFILLMLSVLSMSAYAGPRDLDCRCDYQCTYSDNSKSNHGWTYDKRQAGREFFRQVGSADRNDCRSYCDAFADEVKADALSVAESKGVCGNISCTGTKALKRELGTRKAGQTEWWEAASPININRDESACGDITGNPANSSFGIDYDPCCPPWSKNRLTNSIKEEGGVSGNARRLYFDPPSQVRQDLVDYVEYWKSKDPNCSELGMHVVMTDATNLEVVDPSAEFLQTQIIGTSTLTHGPVIEQHYVGWSTATQNQNVSNIFSYVPPQNKKVKIRTGIGWSNAACQVDIPEKCWERAIVQQDSNQFREKQADIAKSPTTSRAIPQQGLTPRYTTTKRR